MPLEQKSLESRAPDFCRRSFSRSLKQLAIAPIWQQARHPRQHSHTHARARADPATGGVGDNIKAAQCDAAAARPAAAKGAYAYGDAIISAAPMADGSVVRGRFAVASGGASAECGEWLQVGLLQRVPQSLKVSLAWRAAEGSTMGVTGCCCPPAVLRQWMLACFE